MIVFMSDFYSTTRPNLNVEDKCVEDKCVEDIYTSDDL